MDRTLSNVYEELTIAEEQVKAGKVKDAAKGLRASREKLRLATERLASEINKGWQSAEEAGRLTSEEVEGSFESRWYSINRKLQRRMYYEMSILPRRNAAGLYP